MGAAGTVEAVAMSGARYFPLSDSGKGSASRLAPATAAQEWSALGAIDLFRGLDLMPFAVKDFQDVRYAARVNALGTHDEVVATAVHFKMCVVRKDEEHMGKAARV
jgi:hypothetical protein